MKINDDIYYIGANDERIDLFEGQYKVQNGMSYNSYLIKDEKNVVFSILFCVVDYCYWLWKS